jgi:propionyl-CoA synthetase
VIVYMPMIPEAAMAMLACARLGAIHSVVFGGFAANELATRIDDSLPKLVLTASCGIEPGRIVHYKPLLDQAIEMAAHKVPKVILLQRPQAVATMKPGRDLDWVETVKAPAARLRAGRGDRSALHPLHLRARPASPRAWCTTPAATAWRSTGR